MGCCQSANEVKAASGGRDRWETARSQHEKVAGESTARVDDKPSATPSELLGKSVAMSIFEEEHLPLQTRRKLRGLEG